MIYTNRKVTVRNGVSSIDAPIILYRGDREIDIKFEIIDIQFKFKNNDGNLIDNSKASFGQLAIQNPDGYGTFTEIAACEDGQVVLRITGEMIDELHEVGAYSFHIRLFNDDQTSRITIPPVLNGIEIKEPIVIEDDDYGTVAIVDHGQVDEAIIEDEQATFLDENGNLNIEWKKGDVISSLRLNQMVDYINEKEDIPTKTSQLINDTDFATNASVDEKIANINVPSLVGNTLTFGNYTITYNETDDTLDFLYNGVIPIWIDNTKPSSSTGELVENEGSACTEFIPYDSSYEYTLTIDTVLYIKIYYYDSSNSFISNTSIEDNFNGVITPPENAAYMRLKIAKSTVEFTDLDNHVIFRKTLK